MVTFGMPTLLELPSLEACAGLCRELGLSFVEINMNLPQFQIQRLDPVHMARVAGEYGIGYTVHLDENMNIADFNPLIRDAYLETTVGTIELAKRLEIPVLNMHMPLGVYFTLPDRKAYLLEEHGEEYLQHAMRFRDVCTEAIGDSGIKICIENWSGYRSWQLPVLDAMLESNCFGLTFDVGHNFCIRGADEPIVLARRKKLRHMHLHDVKNGTQDHQALGAGELDVGKYLDLARQRDCSVVVETKTVAGLKDSCQWLKEKDLL